MGFHSNWNLFIWSWLPEPWDLERGQNPPLHSSISYFFISSFLFSSLLLFLISPFFHTRGLTPSYCLLLCCWVEILMFYTFPCVLSSFSSSSTATAGGWHYWPTKCRFLSVRLFIRCFAPGVLLVKYHFDIKWRLRLRLFLSSCDLAVLFSVLSVGLCPRMHVCLFTCLLGCLFVCMYVCTYVCMHVCMYVC